MDRLVVITESQAAALRRSIEEQQAEIVFDTFQEAVKGFLKELLVNPIHPEVPGFFKERGFSKDELLKKLVDLDIVKEKNKINDKDGVSRMSLQYSVPASNFRSKVMKLYKNVVEKDPINEDGEGGGAAACGDAGAQAASDGGGFISPVGDSNSGNSILGDDDRGQYSAPFGWSRKKKKNDTDVMRRTLRA